MLAIGLMSGTSLDGVDAALVRIENEKFNLEKFITLNYDATFKKKIMRSLNDNTAVLSEICSLNFELGYKFLEAINLLLKDSRFCYDDISFVASHGQTIWHNPKTKGDLVPSTLQIGEPSVITYHTNITTISNFRTMDIAAGGEGAPLVPMSEFMLFRSDIEDIILQNIGGVANLTYLKKNAKIDDVVAFDTGPGNIMIDYFVNKYFNLPYDPDGKIASSGVVIAEIFNELIKDEFIDKAPPKSTGREQYNQSFMEGLATRHNFDKYQKEDIVTTITEFTVYGMVRNYNKYIKNYDKVILSGGGSHNLYILKRMKQLLQGKSVLTQEDLGFNSDAKEAIAFVVLGYLTLNNRTSNVRSATGAASEVILGNITPRKV